MRKTFLFIIYLFILYLGVFIPEAYAETTPYRSAGWVGSSGDTPFINLGNCQITDGEYCVRPSEKKLSALYFGSFPDLESFRIPLDSVINGVRIRISGKSGGIMYVGIDDRYNQMPARSSCQKPFDRINLYLGPNRSTSELNFTLNSTNGLVNCITLNNINFRNLTFYIAPLLTNVSSTWFSEIDNFEIAFDYTPPTVTPTPMSFPENQKGTVWEIGPDKSNLEQVKVVKDITSVSTWNFHSLALKSDGTVWAWGRNSSGELGNGSTIDSSEPVQVIGPNGEGFLSDIKAIATGNKYSLALRNDGTIWTWGDNSSKHRGVGSNPEVMLLFPVQVKSGLFSDVIAIAAGGFHSLALNSDGTIVAWGSNNVGQLGSGCPNCSIQLTPVRTKNINNVKAISAGGSHSLALKNDGTVWGWGKSSLWELSESGLVDGIGEKLLPTHVTELSNIRAISSKYSYNLAIDNLGKVFEWGEEFRLRVPKEVAGMSDASEVSAGRSAFSFGVMGYAIKEDGTLWELYVNDIPSKLVNFPKVVTAVTSGGYNPALAVVNTTGDVLGDSTIKPFLDLPWEYRKHKLSFNDAAMTINSFFDHSYPLLSTGEIEPELTMGLIENYDPRNQVTTYLDERSDIKSYSRHDGYDWGKRAKAFVDEAQLAAASGSAVYINSCKPCGEAVHIDHHNGFQTRYYHLNDVEAKIKNATGPVNIAQGEKIGTIGFTGRVIPSGKDGAHIHFMVVQDKNGDKNFGDNIPDGLVDPFGWKGASDDPWEKYAVHHNGKHITGNKSLYLWDEKTSEVKEVVKKDVEKEIEIENYKLKYPVGAAALDFTFIGRSVPYFTEIVDGSEFRSICTPLDAKAKDSLGDPVYQFLLPFEIEIDFSNCDLFNVDFDSLGIFSKPSDGILRKENTAIDTANKKASAIINHFTVFALMGKRVDIYPPQTSHNFSGEKEVENNFRSSIKISLGATDGDQGVGVVYTAYMIDDQEWVSYVSPFNIDSEGKYKISYYSEDNDGNVENVKNAEFTIDKTSPKTVANVMGEEGDESWYVSDVNVKLTSTDSGSGVSKIEYSLDHGSTYQQYNNEIHISEDGINEIFYRSVDKAGNIEEANLVTIKIDKTPPSSFVYTSGQRGQENWYRSNVLVEINGNDNVSGYRTSYVSLNNGESYSEYVEPVILSEEKEHMIYYYSVDNAGNKEDEEILEINIDKTAPALSISTNPSRIWPPNGKIVDVKVTGKVIEENLFVIAFNVVDEYGVLKPVLTDFNQIIRLEAKRNGNDLNGRLYQIQVTGEDMAGNNSSSDTRVVVPHSQ